MSSPTDALSAERFESTLSEVFARNLLAMALVDPTSLLLTTANRAWERIFGRCAGVLPRGFDELGFWPDFEAAQRASSLSQLVSGVREIDVPVRLEGGPDRLVCVGTRRLALGQGEVLLVCARDVSEQRAAQRARGEEVERLREAVQRQEQLGEAQRLEALGTLAGGMAHHFNNILSAVVAYTDLIELDFENRAAVQSHVAELRRVSVDAIDLVQQMMTFSGRRKARRVAMRIDGLVRDTAQRLSATLPAAVELDLHVDDASPIVFADASQLEQVMTDLIVNAAHAIGEGPGTIALRLESVEVTDGMARTAADLRVGACARLTVEDTGSGLDDATRARLFEPFFTTKRTGEGRGLGLAAVYGIARQHDAAIRVYSEPGRGTRIELYLPEHRAKAVDARLAPGDAATGRGEHVLLVEDETAPRASIGRLLQSLNYRVTSCATPEAALRAFEAAGPGFDVVLSDVMMPAMTGIELARTMLRSRPDARILLMSGFSGEWTSSAVREYGVRELLMKPLDARTLGSALRGVLEAPGVDSSASCDAK